MEETRKLSTGSNKDGRKSGYPMAKTETSLQEEIRKLSNGSNKEEVQGLDVDTEVETLMEGEDAIVLAEEAGDTKQLNAFSKKLAEMSIYDQLPWQRVASLNKDINGEISRLTSTSEPPSRKISMVHKVPADPYLRKIYYRNELVKQHFVQVENRLFEMFGDKERKIININKFLLGLISTGLRHDDPRLKEMRENLKRVQEHITSDSALLNVDYDTFMSMAQNFIGGVVQSFLLQALVRYYLLYCHQVTEISTHGDCRTAYWKVATYIPQLARESPEHWAVSVCTVDGQRYSIGDVSKPFTIQSCSKPLNYAIASGEYGSNYVHSYVGMEPSGRYFNELCLDFNNKPHNPMINAGAIMTSSLIKNDLSAADRFDYLITNCSILCSYDFVGHSEKAIRISAPEFHARIFFLETYWLEDEMRSAAVKVFLPFGKWYQSILDPVIDARSRSISAITSSKLSLLVVLSAFLSAFAERKLRSAISLLKIDKMCRFARPFNFILGFHLDSNGCMPPILPHVVPGCQEDPEGSLATRRQSLRNMEFIYEMWSKMAFIFTFVSFQSHLSSKMTKPKYGPENFYTLFTGQEIPRPVSARPTIFGSSCGFTRKYLGRSGLSIELGGRNSRVLEVALTLRHSDTLFTARFEQHPLQDSLYF
ncbi:unnamed protein product, partial [Meganyctiphanes norvegica]